MDNRNQYVNPRVDWQDSNGNAAHGEVSFDPVKGLWVGSMLVLGTVGSALTVSMSSVLLFVVTTAITLCFGHSLGMHRRFIHRSYRCPLWLEYTLVHLGTLVGLAGPLGMLKTHDLRDWAQRQSECHPYFAHAEAWYKDAWSQLVCAIQLTSPPTFIIEAKIADDHVYRWMERYWMWQQLPWAFLFYALGGWAWVFWGICSRVSVSIIGHWLIGYFAHNAGHRDWHVDGAAVQGFNVKWCGLITMGESWHNNHHAFPGSAKLGLEPGQLDPGWLVLRGLERVGLASELKIPEHLAHREELHRLDAAESRIF